MDIADMKNWKNMKQEQHNRKGKVRLLTFFLLPLLVFSCATSEMAKQEKAIRAAQMAQSVNDPIGSGRFRIDVDKAHPQFGGRVIDLTSSYYVRVSGDTLESTLPFFGRAYSIPYGGGVGLQFDGKIVGMTSEVNKKKEHIVKMDVTSAEDVYIYIITVYENGSATVSVTPRQRSHIYFTGMLHID